MKHVPFVDSTAVVQLVDFLKHRLKMKSTVLMSGVNPMVRETLMRNSEFKKLMPRTRLFEHTTDAVNYGEKLVK